MADGATQIPSLSVLAELLHADEILIASCRQRGCDSQAVIPLGDRQSTLLRRASIDRLEDNLRCVCGARSGSLGVRPFWGPRPAMTGGIYLFVA